MNKLIAAALTRPVTLVVAVLGLLVFSLMAVLSIPVDIFPKLNAPTIYIAQSYGGMLPSQMEGFMATRYQNQMLYVSGIKNVEVKNVQGLTLVKCSFYEDTNMAQAAGEVANQVTRVQSYLPPGSQPPVVVRFDASTLPVGQLVFSSASRSLSEIQDLASTKIRPLLAQIPGASSPPPFGGNERTVVIKVDPAKMQSYGFTPDQIVQAIVKENQISPAGVVRSGDIAYLAPNNSTVDKVADFGQIPLRLGAGPTVLVNDLATVSDAADQTVGYALVNGKRAVYIPVTKAGDASTMSVVKALKAKLPEMQSLLPPDVRLSYEFDQSVYVSNAVSGLVSEGLIGAILTGLVVLLFLRDWRSSLIVVLTIPVAILASVMLLNMTGSTINIMTLSGLALAIGILVDEATVTIENIHQHLEMGKTKARAILDGCLEVAFPEFLILICILAVFAPSFLMTGIPKAMFLPLSLAIGFAMIVAFLMALTLVPVLANWWMKNHGGEHYHAAEVLDQRELQEVDRHLQFEHRQQQQHLKKPRERISGFVKLKLTYQSILRRLMPYRGWVVGGYLLVTFGLAGLLFVNIGQDMLPHSNVHQFQVRLVGPTGLRIERTEERVRQVLAIIDKLVGHQNVEISSAFVGLTPSSYGTSNLYVFNAGPHEATLQVALNEDLKVNMDDFKDRLRAAVTKAIPGESLSFEPIELTEKIMSQGASTPIEVQVGGKSLGDGKAFADKLLAKMKSVPYLRDLRIKQPLDYPALHINIDRQKAAQFGLTAEDVSKSLVAATSSSRFTAKNLWLDKKSGYAYQVQVQLPEYDMASIADLETLPLVRGQQRPTLGDVATVTRETIAGEYDRSGPRRLVTVSANVSGKDLGTASREVQKLLDSLGAPPAGTTVELQGQAQLLTETLSSLQTGLGLAIVVIFLVLTANFQSFRISVVVLSTIPAVLAGSLGLLWLTGSTLNLQSYMGIIMSVGVSVANAILMITNSETLRLQYRDSARAAVTAGGMRLRPILMTSIAMIAGMLPMASGLGETGDQSAPLGRAVIGGLFFSAIAALLILPLVFALVMRKSSVDSVSLNPDDTDSLVYDAPEVTLKKVA
ncbi:efflux RND transporter permease subunit [Hymenobacter sp. UV11]|uniref:efflux RND transporter permease subunit n=1 Tax=Hymenobacter sp. UV11 TaxID=1849735 RepID=UPI0010622BD1|nr:efflux RND transporter permease subunit [Hymenobacter sp. UV11]TDN40608.1 acriflavin resistance protein [Hymenobacter sp. UV11]TFZ66373.1 efflux RND transporter permease subunit [Hymenobacter sp. UV11]